MKDVNALEEEVKLSGVISSFPNINVPVPQSSENPFTSAPQARKNELAVEGVDGGTFTMSNGGVC